MSKIHSLLPALSGEETQLLIALLCVSLFVLAYLRRRRPRQTKAARQHAFNERRSWKDLETVRGMDPKANPGRVITYLRKIDPYRFEDVILTELQRRKLRIQRNASYSGDGGIDGQFWLGEELWLIQAKRYQGFIKAEHVWAFEAICQQRQARGLFVHTGKTPDRLRQLRRQCGVVRIISGQELIKFVAGDAVSLVLKEGRPSVAKAPSPAPAPALASEAEAVA